MGDIVAINFKKSHPFIMYYKTNFSQKEYKTIDIRSHGKRNQSYPEKNDIILKCAYNSPPKLSSAKKEDLLSLCHSNLIPEQYHSFFESLLTEQQSIITPKTTKQAVNKTTKKTEKKTIKKTEKKTKNVLERKKSKSNVKKILFNQ